MLDPTGYAAVIFDLDGVLLDSEPIHLAVINEILALEGHHLDEEANRAYLGVTTVACWEDLCARLRLRHPLDYYLGAYDRILRALGRPIEPAPGVPELLRLLRRRGVPVALASSSRRPWIEASLAATGLSQAFPVAISGDDVSRGKPDPEIFRLTAQALGVEPARCLVIEDSPHGVQAARAAGMDVVAVRTPQTAGHPFEAATVVVDSLEALRPR
jgi:HAD superfamily hydrolase (TIGR01509 family)